VIVVIAPFSGIVYMQNTTYSPPPVLSLLEPILVFPKYPTVTADGVALASFDRPDSPIELTAETL
jgi:hypothetical protein